MSVVLPDGAVVQRTASEARHQIRAEVFGPSARNFFDWQEKTADALWDFALRFPDWPPQSLPQLVNTAQKAVAWLASDPHNRLSANLLADIFRPAAHHLKHSGPRLRAFVDGQLLISAQTTSEYANALYAASALDLPRRGVVHLRGGIGAIAETLVAAIRSNGGKVHFRKEVTGIQIEKGRPVAVELKRDGPIAADFVIANLTPWNLERLLGSHAPPAIRALPRQPRDGWGAFMVYAGIDAQVLEKNQSLHTQILQARPFGEGNSIFLSISPKWDPERAPAGRRAVTISTHTSLKSWWELFEQDRAGYQARREAYLQRILALVEQAIPGFRQAVQLALPGTPITFQRFTRRAWGWVGGFPQSSLFRTWGPRVMPGLWLVGDSIFPGQSTAAVAMGGIRVAADVQRALADRTSLAVVNQSGAGYATSGD
jgi:phytoene dehydrogenase-like protein